MKEGLINKKFNEGLQDFRDFFRDDKQIFNNFPHFQLKFEDSILNLP